MEVEDTKTISVAALSRAFGLGMLYDVRDDSLVPGLSLWDHDDLSKYTEERPQCYSDFEVIASDSTDAKSSALDMEASLKASFLSGTVQVEGSAKYLKNKKTSKNQARVVLKYAATTKFKELSMSHLRRDKVKHPDLFEKGVATHVVTAILYGVNAFFVFDSEESSEEESQKIQGKMKATMEKFKIGASVEGSVNINETDKTTVNKFSCKFHGDFLLEKSPVTFQDAIEVYKSLPKFLEKNQDKVVPVKVWLLPLTYLEPTATRLVRQISAVSIHKAKNILEDFDELDMRCNDVLKNTAAQQFPKFGQQMKTFKDLCFHFKGKFQETLAKKLLSIRGGNEEETELADILKKHLSSSFGPKLKSWLDVKEKEINTLMAVTNKMKNVKVVASENELHKEVLDADQSVCFVLNLMAAAESFLTSLSKCMDGAEETDSLQNPKAEDDQGKKWIFLSEVFREVWSKAKLFGDFAEDNKSNNNIKFLAVGLKNESESAASIYLYKEGMLVKRDFEPPAEPKSVKVQKTATSVTLKIDPPQLKEEITAYLVEYCVSGKDEWQQKSAPSTGEVEVSGLTPDTEYIIKCRTVTSAGAGLSKEIRIHTCE
ncbi:neoverrucotoxin subunit beta-like [Pholidichthys leucotaenia]